ncbi:MAG TPA: c-type cytochrome [Fimbriimonadaceae bacterium]|nr:c-type cytochrome [Fimbriimonadaceae bacterium]
MKNPALISLACLSIAVFAAQSSLPSNLANHVKLLEEAPSFKATLSVLAAGGAPETVKITFAKPNLFTIERNGGSLWCDGQTLTEYFKSTNTYTQVPVNEKTLGQIAAWPETFAWAPVLLKETAKNIKSAKVGAKRNIKGNMVTEVAATLSGPMEGTATLFVDDKLGVARGFSVKSGNVDLLVTASELEVGKEAKAATAFKFNAPAGATKAEAPPKPAATFASVQALFNKTCMPCHNATSMSAGYNLTTYDGVIKGIAPGDADNSRIVRSIRSGRMPKNGRKLPQADIDLVVEWVNAGAKQ